MKFLAALSLIAGMCFSTLTQANAVAIGVTEPRVQISLTMPVSGIVRLRKVHEGSQVVTGDLLLELDREIEALDMESKRIQAKDNAAITELEKRISILEKQVRNGRELLERGGISEKQIQDEELALAAARADLQSQRLVKKREKIDYELAVTYFNRRQLTSPITGTVTNVTISEGESVKPQEPLIVLVDVSRIKFKGTFSLIDTERFKVGDIAWLQVSQHGQTIMREASVTYVAPVADPASGLIEIIAEIDNEDRAIIPGTTAELTLSPPGEIN